MLATLGTTGYPVDTPLFFRAVLSSYVLHCTNTITITTMTDPIEFYERIVEGTDGYKYVELERESGMTLENVRVTPVNKTLIAQTVERLPEEIFEAAEENEDAEEFEEELEDQGTDTEAFTENTVKAFEKLCKESLEHENLTDPQMERLVEELEFEVLFGLGGDIFELSYEQSGQIKDFREQD